MFGQHDEFDRGPLDKAERLQNGLLARSENKTFSDVAYADLRRFFLSRPEYADKAPDFLRRCGSLGQFWAWIKENPHYHERREVIWNVFRPLLDYLEAQERTPGVEPITTALAAFDPENVHAVWQKALDRRAVDPEGAITAARTLLETTCKHILDDAGVVYAPDTDLPKLWAQTAEAVNLAPSQHQESVFKAILGNCQSVVNNLAAIRNKVGDAHGQGRKPVKPKPRHAELAVNLAGAMASFLIETWSERQAPPE